MFAIVCRLKKLQQAKKQRDKERKDLELMNRKHLANVRVKQRNQVHVQGLTTKMANEDVSGPILEVAAMVADAAVAGLCNRP